MESGETCGSVIGRMKKVDNTRRTWTAREEEVWITALQDVITKGWKIENGFKAGYLTLLESAMHTAIPGTNLRGNSCINSKVHVWKKTYSTLVTSLGKSDVGWNDTDNTVEATNETWDTIIKADSTFRSMRHKQWTHYPDWREIFGNDRATGEHFQMFENALNMCSNSMMMYLMKSTTTSKKRKRKQVNKVDEAIVAAINNLAYITKVTMNDLVKQLAAPDNLSDAQDVVLDAWREMSELSEDEHVIAAQLLFNNHNNLALFKRLNDKGKLSLVKGYFVVIELHSLVAV
ncbi:hypothetical protein F511_14485 [Dorcoceras hygrometricum]|uniref:Myb/SANT-like domain-containing protein n=1 Tax=Dorcoceras hygrometricum TaxID=472368 RepID=A0A2Z7CEK2_9LAMI|nr:hypothetical protein F511_14485 [Dorcoceras hygrometricum]